MNIEHHGPTESHLLAGGLAVALIMMLCAFLFVDCLSEMHLSDAEKQKLQEKKARGQVSTKPVKKWALLGMCICAALLKHVHHTATRAHLEKVAAAPDQGPEGPPTMKLKDAKEEHVFVAGFALALMLLLAAFLVIDTLRGWNQSGFMPQNEVDRRASLRCFAIIAIIICLCVVKNVHHSSYNAKIMEHDSLHGKHYAPEHVKKPQHAAWIEEHGVLRVHHIARDDKKKDAVDPGRDHPSAVFGKAAVKEQRKIDHEIEHARKIYTLATEHEQGEIGR